MLSTLTRTEHSLVSMVGSHFQHFACHSIEKLTKIIRPMKKVREKSKNDLSKCSYLMCISLKLFFSQYNATWHLCGAKYWVAHVANWIGISTIHWNSCRCVVIFKGQRYTIIAFQSMLMSCLNKKNRILFHQFQINRIFGVRITNCLFAASNFLNKQTKIFFLF